MFELLSEKMLGSIKKITGKGKITEKNIEETIKEIRLNLLEADVNFKVVKKFIEKVKDKALGKEVVSSLEPGQVFTKIVHDELIEILGGGSAEINLKGIKNKPSVIFLVGLQGSGKTTSSAKLALYLRKKFKKKTGLVSVDVYRPAAIEQLNILATTNQLAFFENSEKKPHKILKKAIKWAEDNFIETLIIDTAGRHQIDKDMMKELNDLSSFLPPQEVLLVVDAMLGQQSVNIAQGFNENLSLSGLILTKIDGDARGGAALSIREASGIPIKFIADGEKINNFEIFHPDRLASRILDMGDVLSLVEKAQEFIDEKEARDTARKMSKNDFTVKDFFKQIQYMKKLGGIGNIMKMLPGMGNITKQLGDTAVPDKELKKIEAIINSMTVAERHNHKILNGSRRLRIAKGSGTEVKDINKFINQFEQMKKMMSSMMKKGAKGMFDMKKNPFF